MTLQERLFRSLYRIRRVEEEIAAIYPTDKIKSPIHLSIGQEAVSVGICEALRPDDAVFGTYRGHALYLAKGGDLKAMIAELYGKATGCARGKGGSMHLIDPQAGLWSTSAVVGTTIPHAVGFAYALRLRGSDAVAVSFFGDGAVEEGVFHESLNFAALKRLPVLFVCENNRYAIHSPQHQRQPQDNIWERGRAYGIPGRRFETDDPETLYHATAEAVAAIRAGEGPYLFECLTYRWREHVGPNEDFDAGYRSRAEAEPWMNNDPVVRLREALPEATVQRIVAEVEAEIAAAFRFAEESPWPKPEALWTDLYADGGDQPWSE